MFEDFLAGVVTTFGYVVGWPIAILPEDSSQAMYWGALLTWWFWLLLFVNTQTKETPDD